MPAITESDVSAKVGLHVSSICPTGFHGDEHNHCAHFVCHLLDYDFGYTCYNQTGKKGAKACIRVHELFRECLSVGDWSWVPTPATWLLIFMTNPSNVDLARKTMQNVPRKHVGFFFTATQSVYHYKNAHKKVVKQTLADFKNHYQSPDNGLFWGTAW
jgi:hypothetical protein